MNAETVVPWIFVGVPLTAFAVAALIGIWKLGQRRRYRVEGTGKSLHRRGAAYLRGGYGGGVWGAGSDHGGGGDSGCGGCGGGGCGGGGGGCGGGGC